MATRPGPGPRRLALIFLLAGCAAIRPVDPGLSARLGELLLVGFRGTEVEENAELRHLLCDLKVGGVILYERDVATSGPRNITSPEQVQRLTRDLRARALSCAGRAPLIAADNEGGAVMRLNARAGYPPTLGHGELGELDDVALTELEARRIGRMLREAGIDWNLAPVVDVAANPFNTVLVQSGRTFSQSPERVTTHARAYLRGMHAAGILTALKHFPGHGSSFEDSHLGFVDVTRTADLAAELLPYRALIGEGAADAVMTAHVFNRNVDPRHPATLSAPTIEGVLRRELGFTGLVVSDDLLMEGIVSRYGIEEAAVLALRAGVDLLLLSHNTLAQDQSATDRVINAIRQALADGRLSPEQVETALARVQSFRASAR
ncbi:MAG: glycoside hydrolase family 3 [Candidatus Rokubacteria bacterium]|nr:glycoside hydrolase family 3 [Candidatus Rokubacteria bacterium]